MRKFTSTLTSQSLVLHVHSITTFNAKCVKNVRTYADLVGIEVGDGEVASDDHVRLTAALHHKPRRLHLSHLNPQGVVLVEADSFLDGVWFRDVIDGVINGPLKVVVLPLYGPVKVVVLPLYGPLTVKRLNIELIAYNSRVQKSAFAIHRD